MAELREIRVDKIRFELASLRTDVNAMTPYQPNGVDVLDSILASLDRIEAVLDEQD